MAEVMNPDVENPIDITYAKVTPSYQNFTESVVLLMN